MQIVPVEFFHLSADTPVVGQLEVWSNNVVQPHIHGGSR